MIDLIEHSRNTQESIIDGIYDNLICEIILNEMEIKVPKFTNKEIIKVLKTENHTGMTN